MQDTLQRDINATMRGILVDWLVEVAEEYKLVPDTLFLSVAYIDRCLSLMPVRPSPRRARKDTSSPNFKFQVTRLRLLRPPAASGRLPVVPGCPP